MPISVFLYFCHAKEKGRGVSLPHPSHTHWHIKITTIQQKQKPDYHLNIITKRRIKSHALINIRASVHTIKFVNHNNNIKKRNKIIFSIFSPKEMKKIILCSQDSERVTRDYLQHDKLRMHFLLWIQKIEKPWWGL